MLSPKLKTNVLRLVLGSFLVLVIGCGRPGDKGRIRPPEPLPQRAISPESAPTFKTHNDRFISVRVPTSWNISTVPSTDAKLHMVDFRNSEGMYARVTVVQETSNPGSFPFEIIQNLKRANKSVSADPYRGRIAEKDARGYSYVFQIEDKEWKGWVLSYAQGRNEICFLGQYPASGESSFKGQLQQVMNTLKVVGASKASQSSEVEPVTTNP